MSGGFGHVGICGCATGTEGRMMRAGGAVRHGAAVGDRGFEVCWRCEVD